MPTDVFAHQLDTPIDGDRRGGMHRSRVIEQCLLSARDLGKGQDRGNGEGGQIRWSERRQPLDEFIDGSTSAQATTRRRVPESRSGSWCAAARLDGDDVELALDRRSVGAITHSGDRMTVQESVREAEADRQFVIVSGSAHRRGDEFTIELDREWFFHYESIGRATRCIAVEFDDEHGVDPLSSHVAKTTVRGVTADDRRPDDDPSWDLVRPAGGAAYNTRPPQPPDRPVLDARERDPLLASDPEGNSWLLTPDVVASTRNDDRGTAVLYGVVTFIATAVVGLIVSVAVTGPAESTPITTPVVSYTPRTTLAISSSDAASDDNATVDPPIASDDSSSAPSPSTTAVTEESSIGSPIVIATAEGVLRETSVGTTRLIDGAFDVIIAVGDGTYLAQARSGRDADPLDTSILRLSPQGVPTRVLEPAEGATEWFTLHDVTVRNGSFTALVTVATGTTSDDSRETIALVPLDSSQRIDVLTRDSWQSTTAHLSIGSDLLVGEVVDSSNSSEIVNRPLILRLVDLADGTLGTETVASTPFGLADSYSDCFVCPRVFGIDSSGQRLGWIEGDLVVIVDISSTQRLLVVPLPQGTGERIVAIDIGSGGILLNRRLSIDGPFQRALVVTDDGSIGASTHFGRATFASDVAG